MEYGKKVWIFPDTELPPVGQNEIPGHESVIIVNTTEKTANVKVTFLYSDKQPLEGISVEVLGNRVRCLRTTEDFDGVMPTVGEQYAIMLESNVPIVAQYGRAEPRPVSFYTTPGYCE